MLGGRVNYNHLDEGSNGSGAGAVGAGEHKESMLTDGDVEIDY